MGWSDWISVAGSVLDIASSVAELVGREKDDDAAPVMLGTVQFTSEDGITIAENLDPNYGTFLTYSAPAPQANGSMGTVSQVQFLAPTQNPPPNTSSKYNCSSDLSTYLAGGNLAISGVLYDGTTDTITSALSFALRSIALGATINIVGGISASFGTNPQTGNMQLTIQSTGPQLQSATVRVTGADGKTFKGSMTFNNPKAKHLADGTIGAVDLPPGMVLDPLVSELDIDMEIDDSTARRLIFGK